MNATPTCGCGCGEAVNIRNGTASTYRRGHNRRLAGSKGWIEGGYRYFNVEGVKVAEHRLVVERREGRKLASGEVVHHVDGDPLNNDPANLVVLSRTEHHRLHATGSTRKRWSDEEKARARGLHRAGMTIQEVSKVLGRPFSSTALYVRTEPDSHVSISRS
jgi:HNH endonuclease